MAASAVRTEGQYPSYQNECSVERDAVETQLLGALCMHDEISIHRDVRTPVRMRALHTVRSDNDFHGHPLSNSGMICPEIIAHCGEAR